MSNKNKNFVATSKDFVATIDFYNQRVKDALLNNPLNTLQQQAIKLFKDNATRNKFTVAVYNKEVEIFNNRHGLLIEKLADNTATQNIGKSNYHYINYPFLDRAAVKQTMDNYRKFVFDYNKKVADENKEITNYNSSIVYTKDKKILQQIKLFEQENKSDFTRVYNRKVEEFNESRIHPYLSKRRIQKVKYQTEIYFQTLVGFYVKQLQIRNYNLLEMNLSTSTSKKELPHLKIDHKKVAKHKIANIPRLDICKKTAQNHTKRLREAGALIDYVYVNQNRPISIRFNTSIIEVLDGNLPKLQNAEKQLVKGVSWKILHDNNDTTRTFLKEKEIKDNVSNIVDNECGSMLESSSIKHPADSYKNTTEIYRG